LIDKIYIRKKIKKSLKNNTMSQIGNLVASSAVVFNLDFLPERFLIAQPDTDVPLSQISVVTSGTQIMSVTAAARIRALAQFDQGANLGADVKVPMWLRMAFGRINKATTINATNSGAYASMILNVTLAMVGKTRKCITTRKLFATRLCKWAPIF
jgi:hypothetical protein